MGIGSIRRCDNREALSHRLTPDTGRSLRETTIEAVGTVTPKSCRASARSVVFLPRCSAGLE